MDWYRISKKKREWPTCSTCDEATEELSKKEAKELLQDVDGWSLAGDKITKSFEFDDFKGAMDLGTKAGEIAEAYGHHPRITVEWGKATIEIWTHKVDGLTMDDLALAAKLDEKL